MKSTATEALAVQGIIDSIKSLHTALQNSDLEYLRHISWLSEWGASARAEEGLSRIDGLYQMCTPESTADLLKGDKFLIVAYTSPEYPLLMTELPAIGKIVEYFQAYGEVVFDFGTKEGQGDYIDIDVIATKQ